MRDLKLSLIMALRSLLNDTSYADVVAFCCATFLMVHPSMEERLEWLTISIDGCVGSINLSSSVGMASGVMTPLVPTVSNVFSSGSLACSCSLDVARSRLI